MLCSHRTHVPRPFRLIALAASLGLIALAPAPAFAQPAVTSGTVVIHAANRPQNDPSQDSHVCEFRIVARNFVNVPFVVWTISHQPATLGGQVKNGKFGLDDGAGQSEVMSLPAGQYRLDVTFEGHHAAPESKVFRSTCGTTPTEEATEDECPTATSPEEPTEGTNGTEEGLAPTEEATRSHEALVPTGGPGTVGSTLSPSRCCCPSPPMNGKLAQTGAAFTPWLALAGAVTAVGGGLVGWTRRNRRQH